MNFGIRLLVSEIAAFLLFPLAFIIRYGVDEAGWMGDYILILILQFISPYGYWVFGLVFGLAGSIVWQLVVSKRKAVAGPVIGPIYADHSS